jgi:hypothetical protein
MDRAELFCAYFDIFDEKIAIIVNNIKNSSIGIYFYI